MKANITQKEKQNMINFIKNLDQTSLQILWTTMTKGGQSIADMDKEILTIFFTKLKIKA
jgi:hypothetical protein